jgi:hypothetical protein
MHTRIATVQATSGNAELGPALLSFSPFLNGSPPDPCFALTPGSTAALVLDEQIGKLTYTGCATLALCRCTVTAGRDEAPFDAYELVIDHNGDAIGKPSGSQLQNGAQTLSLVNNADVTWSTERLVTLRDGDTLQPASASGGGASANVAGMTFTVELLGPP